MTYTQAILRDLASGEWTCGSTWYARAMPTFSQRLSSVNAKEPGRIESRVCHRHDHASTIHEYRDRNALRPKQLELVA